MCPSLLSPLSLTSSLALISLPSHCIAVFSLLLDFVSDDTQPRWNGYFYAVLMFVVTLTQSLLIHQHWDIVFRVGMRIRSSVIAAVYRKVA